MTIRRRLALSFATILLLFVANLGVYFWGKQKQSSAVETLRRAVSRQLLVASLTQSLNNMQKQIALLSEVMVEAVRGGAGPEEIAQFDAQLQTVSAQIEELKTISEPNERQDADSLAQDYQELSASWRVAYRSFGVNQSKAVLELATKADPLSQRVTLQILPQLQQDEQRRMAAATAGFEQVGQLTERITILILFVSIGVAVLVAYRLSNYLSSGLSQLEMGAAIIGQGQLEHRIELKSSDELGDLAKAYNEMAGKLQSARTQLLDAKGDVERRHQELEEQRQMSESLLVNILPVQVAKELKEKGAVAPKYFEDVSVIFTDFVGFTLSTEKLAAEDLVSLLHEYFTGFDEIVTRYYMEKLKTIGDSYMYVGGMPLGRRARRSPSHPVDAVMAALEMVRLVAERQESSSHPRWAVRIGIHTGPVIAGVVGIQKFAFDVWGQTVNYASRMESSGVANRINISHNTYLRVKDFFDCEYRGKVLTKEKREADMYLVNGVLPALLQGEPEIPPEPFLRRYRIYFQKEPPSFPDFLSAQVRDLAG